MSMTEDELKLIEMHPDLQYSPAVHELIAEVRRLQVCFDNIRKNFAISSTDRERGLDGSLFAMTVERDSLRKMLDDANGREELQLDWGNKAQAALNQFQIARAAWIHCFQAPDILKALQELKGEPCSHVIGDNCCAFAGEGVGDAGYSYCIKCGERKPVPMCQDPVDDASAGEGRPT